MATSMLVNNVGHSLIGYGMALAHMEEYPCSSKERLLGIVSV